MTAAEPNISAAFYRDGARDYVRIEIKGSSDTVIRQASALDIERFSKEWEAYQAGLGECEPDGIPLDQVPGLSRNQIIVLKLNRILTADELAAVDDAVIMNLGMGMRGAQRAARLLVENRDKDARMEGLRARLAALEGQAKSETAQAPENAPAQKPARAGKSRSRTRVRSQSGEGRI